MSVLTEIPISVKSDVSDRKDPGEQGFYLDHQGDQLYCVIHFSWGAPRARILLAGPFGPERERAYVALVHWARTLASAGFEVLRFDYRGLGESTGRFEDMTLADWKADLAYLPSVWGRRQDRVPLVLQGLRIGALLASEVFSEGVGDGLLLWMPPPSAKDHLWEALRRNLASEVTLFPHKIPRSREAYVADLESGRTVTVDGYPWSLEQWQEAAVHALALPTAGEQRPWRLVENSGVPGTDPHRTRVASPSLWENSIRLAPEGGALFSASIDWLNSSFPPTRTET